MPEQEKAPPAYLQREAIAEGINRALKGLEKEGRATLKRLFKADRRIAWTARTDPLLIAEWLFGPRRTKGPAPDQTETLSPQVLQRFRDAIRQALDDHGLEIESEEE